MPCPNRPGSPITTSIPNLLARANKWAAQFFQQCLNDPEKGKHAREYVAGRGIAPESVRSGAGTGAERGGCSGRQSGPTEDSDPLLQQAGLITASGQDKFVNRLMFTITDVTGRVIAFGGRTLNDTGAKYINSPTTPLFDKSNTLFGLEQARHQIVATGTAIVVEGYIDVIMPHQFGCTNVVATLGTSFTAGHGRILRRYAKKVVLLFDSDTAGMAAANRALEVCLSQHLDIKLAFVPQGKDPCDFVLVAGKEGFEAMIEQATDVLQYKWDRLHERFAADDTLASRKAAVEEFLQAVAIGFGSNNIPVLERGLIVNRLAKMIGMGEAEIRKELDRRIKPPSEPVRTDGRTAGALQTTDWGQGLYASAQREILEVLLNEPGLFHRVEQEVSQDLFDVPVLGQIASILLDVVRVRRGFLAGQRAGAGRVGGDGRENRRVTAGRRREGQLSFAVHGRSGGAARASGSQRECSDQRGRRRGRIRRRRQADRRAGSTRTASASREDQTSLNPCGTNNYVKKAVQQVNP